MSRTRLLTPAAVRSAVQSSEVIALAARFAVRSGLTEQTAIALFRCAFESELERQKVAATAPTEPPPPDTQ